TDPVGKRTPLAPRCEPQNVGHPAGGLENARQNLQRRRLAGAVRPNDRDAFALGDFKGDAANGIDSLKFRGEDAPQRAGKSAPPPGVAVGLPEITDGNDGHDTGRREEWDADAHTRISGEPYIIAIPSSGATAKSWHRR